MGQELPHGALPTVTSFYEEVTSEGDVAFQWARLPSGARATYELTQAPGGSAATVSLSGVLEGVDLPGSYVVVRSVYLGLGLLYREVGVCVWPQTSTPILSLTAPSPVTIVAGTTTGSITFPAATGGTAPYTYDAVVTYDSPLTGAAYVSGVSTRTASLAGLTNGGYYEVTMTVTDADGSTASQRGIVLVASAAAGTMTPGAFPAAQTLAADQTTASITFNDVGGTFTAPVTYVATISSGPGSVSNTGKSVSLSGLVAGTGTVVRLRATDSSGSPKTADAFALVVVSPAVTNPLAWVPVRDIDFTDAANALASITSGSQSVPLVDEATGQTITCTLIVSMIAGSLTNCPSSIGTDGWKIAHSVSTATSTNTKQPMKIPLPSPIGNDDDFRVTVWGRTNLPVSNNHCHWQVCHDKGGATPNEDDNDCWGGNRILKNGAASALYLKYQAGGSPAIISNSSTPPCPLTWLDGSTEIKMEMYLPRYTNRARMRLTGGGATVTADLGSDGKTASNNALRGGWVAGDSNVWIVHCAANGAANGLGAQYSTITRILIERRTLP
jgi:hypothetical protein